MIGNLEQSSDSSQASPVGSAPVGRTRSRLSRALTRSALIVLGTMAVAGIVSLGVGAFWPDAGADGNRDGSSLVYGPLSIAAALVVTRPGILNLRRNAPSVQVPNQLLWLYTLITVVTRFMNDNMISIFGG